MYVELKCYTYNLLFSDSILLFDLEVFRARGHSWPRNDVAVRRCSRRLFFTHDDRAKKEIGHKVALDAFVTLIFKKTTHHISTPSTHHLRPPPPTHLCCHHSNNGNHTVR
eukprot:TRINITY_DN6750_c0_g1_i1.p1 TRINITY_DN6750_c0_g1~~TRINITY_DN6750_c0_g1_i1.p1  ORF type:complete len:110 (-),score=9.89 TRINITY_DN6750_c0_g1_i1:64-393(-)